ncbi:hypothetical protein CHS0354_018284, partial [Potamilus streckersoni]
MVIKPKLTLVSITGMGQTRTQTPTTTTISHNHPSSPTQTSAKQGSVQAAPSCCSNPGLLSHKITPLPNK